MHTLSASRSEASVARLLRWTGIITTVGMFIVVAMGDLVTNAGAAEGCGRSWPLCKGQIVPVFTAATLIEFSHRLVVAVVSVGVIVLAAGAWLHRPARRELRLLAPAMVLFLLLQAVLGGAAVKWPQSPPVLALHLGVSLIAFATVLLTTAMLLEERSADRWRDRPAPVHFRRLVWVALLYLYLLVYLGAFVRHSHAELACTGWPLCDGAVVPDLQGLALINVAHRVAALIGACLFAVLWWQARRLRGRRPDLYWASTAAGVCLLAQALSGALVALSQMALWSALLHGALVALVFGAVSYLCLHILPRSPIAETASQGESAVGSAMAVGGNLTP